MKQLICFSQQIKKRKYTHLFGFVRQYSLFDRVLHGLNTFLENYTFYAKYFLSNSISHIFQGSSHVSTDLSSEEQYAGMLLLKFLYVIKHNAFEIIETLWDEQYVNAINAFSIGSGIYVFHSYFNHSCDANAAKTIPRNKIISHSIQLIKAGEKVSFMYIIIRSTPINISYSRLNRYQYQFFRQ